jgi:hypothetical protein
MASYKGHLAFSTLLGTAYGGAALWKLELDWGPALLGAGVTALGGLLPDLDSDSGVPVRELFGLAAAVVPLLCYHRLSVEFTPERTIVLLACLYLFIRYGLSSIFKQYSVHRGMFHSIPAMLIAGLAVYQLYHTQSEITRCYVAVGVMLGFLSHLVLDELYSVDFMGARIRLNKYAGSALKLWSPSLGATMICYALLGFLVWSVWRENQPWLPVSLAPSRSN